MAFCKYCNRKISSLLFASTHIANCESYSSEANDRNEAARSIRESPMKATDHFIAKLPRKPDPYVRQKDSIYDGMFSDNVRKSVQEELNSYLHNEKKLQTFVYENFNDRLAISGTVADEAAYYRKMAQGELDALQGANGNGFNATFDYHNAQNYRYWMSSSLAKVDAFGNANAADDGNRVVRFNFSSSVWSKFQAKIKAHQEPGVQGDSSKVAVHREGFAELGTIDCEDHVTEIKGPPFLDHNLGFTRDQSDELWGHLNNGNRYDIIT